MAAPDDADAAGELPVPWDKNPTEVGYARLLFDKFKGAHGELERTAFEQMISGLLGTAAAARKKREQRTHAWFSAKGDKETVAFVPFLKVLTGSGVSVKILAMNYEGVLDPRKKEPERLSCPHCGKDLPGNYRMEERRDLDEETEEDENTRLLKKLEDIEKRRATLTMEATRKSIDLSGGDLGGTVQTLGATAGTPPADVSARDPRLARLTALELEGIETALERLETAGFSEIEVQSLHRAVCSRKATVAEDSSPPACRHNSTTKTAEEEPSSTLRSGSFRAFGGDGDGEKTSPRSAAVHPPDHHHHPERPKARASVAGVERPSSRSRESVSGSGSRRKSHGQATRGSVSGARASVSGGVHAAHAAAATQRRSSVGLPGQRPTTPGTAAKAIPAPPPPEPNPHPPVPEGCVKMDELQAAPLRRTEKLVDSVRRCEHKMVKQWAEGGELNVWVDGKVTLAHVAVEAKKPHAIDVLKMVATPVSVAAFSDLGETPLHLAARLCLPEKVRALKELGADFGAKDARGHTALHIAARQPTGTATCRALIECGADTAATDGEGSTPLHLACSTQVCMALLEGGCSGEPQDCRKNTPAHAMILRGVFDDVSDPEVVRRLFGNTSVLAAQNEAGDTPLHCVVERGGHRLADALVRLGADVEVQNKGTHTPLGMVKQKWQQEAGNPQQVDWSATLICFGHSLSALATKGTQWYCWEGHTWHPVDDQDGVITLVDKRRQAGRSLQWELGAPETGDAAWVGTAKEFRPGDWVKVRCDFPPDTKGEPSERLVVDYTPAEGDQVITEYRLLPCTEVTA
eukprot:TRINITY_DN15071_c0_g1_i1.p1 TRINITY_DN15071_c0_g1~~TRINITY_DN15071_c0_g1_i1.p1  ORF type:complete len:841 (+),score=261.74 TRINITY_DN15071_c0_g1_i1:110-2524(+)